jgi:hypothetical protein
MREMENETGSEETRNAYKISVGKTQGNHFMDISVDGRILLKCIYNAE